MNGRTLPGKPTVAVVVVSYDAEPWLERCLRSCRDSSYPLQVFVVDNASSDGTLEIARRFDEVVLMPQATNLGFGAGNNIGMGRALREGMEFVFLLNQDAFLDRRTVETLLDVAGSHPEYGVLSPLHLAEDGRSIDPLLIEHIAGGSKQLISDLRTDELDPVYPMPFINAAAWLLSRRCLETVGGFDPLFFLYGEDDDYCRRALHFGIHVGLVPAATVVHVRGGGSSAALPKPIGMKSRANREYLRMVLELKRLEQSFGRTALGMTFDVLSRLTRLMLGGRFYLAATVARAYLGLLRRLPTVRRHRALCATPGPHWLQ